MDYNDDAKLDTSSVSDTRGSRLSGGSGLAIGGGGVGVLGVLAFLLVQFLGGGGSGSNGVVDILSQLGQNGQPATADNSQISSECKTGADADKNSDCATVANIDSIQQYWRGALPTFAGKQYTDATTVFFSGAVSTACGNASSSSGPFYCPGDSKVYIDLSFYQQLQTDFGAEGGPFVNAYILAHEYGHHVQDLSGVTSKVKPGETGANSGSVRLELQADCYAGVWAKNATLPGKDGSPALISSITSDDISRALDAAGRIGDDYIQKNLGNGTVQQNTFTHGSSAQRQKWFQAGYSSGDPKICDTFTPATV